MVERISALAGQAMPLSFGPELTLSERRLGAIWQLAAWPDRIADAAARAAALAGADAAPGPRRAIAGSAASLLRTEPLKWLLVSETDEPPPDLGDAGTAVDLSHARTVIRIEGAAMPELMARLMPLDTRPDAMPEGSVATSGLHHIAVTVHLRDGGADLYAFRSFGLSLWEHVIETADQFAVA